MPFTKWHGLGNDFIICRSEDLPRRLPEFARAITDRHRGVGADGLLAVSKARRKEDHAQVRFFNSDGSEAEMSGNGIRCVAGFLASRGLGRRLLRVETLSGTKTLGRVGKGSRDKKWIFRVAMGAPVFSPAKIPFRAGHHSPPLVAVPLRTRLGVVPVTVTSMGNPHCSVMVRNLDRSDWERWGREIEHHRLFPNRTNVEFVKPISRTDIEVRFWERGVGPTLASGTGSCAAAVACILNGLTERKVRVGLPLGTLQVAWPEDGEVILTGPVEMVASGVYHLRAAKQAGVRPQPGKTARRRK